MRFIAFLIFSCVVFSEAARSEPIGEADLLKHIEILASDAFEGREPGTLGENRTVNYIATQWARAGLRPAGEGGSWYVPVTLVERRPQHYHISFAGRTPGKSADIDQSEIVLRSRTPSFQQNQLPVVFAGFAQSASGAQSVAGKLVLMPRAPLDDSDAMPDFQARKRQLMDDGAIGVLSIIVRQDRWPAFRRYFQRESTALPGPDHHAPVEGIISFDQFGKLAKQSGRDAAALLADRDGVSVVDLGMVADATVETSIRTYISHNVIGKIPGSDRKSGAVLFMGHWDHFGICRIADPEDPGKDRICNGAVDNASGISLLIETAIRLSREPHDRDIYFLATTAEEKGLLGARAFIENPSVALDSFVAAFNADTIALSANEQKIAVIGLGEAGLDRDIEIVAAQENREIDDSGTADPYLGRQDGYLFLERGIPTYMITSAFADAERLKAFIDGPYHDVGDEVNDGLILTGAAADANFHVALGRYFGSTARYPGKAPSGAADN
jgi:Zn-dependent M28 family amino/carboxypeptidase